MNKLFSEALTVGSVTNNLTSEFSFVYCVFRRVYKKITLFCLSQRGDSMH